ncbi:MULTISPECIES: hypothetical protein [Butyricimonas]|uniref:Gliding motility-associated lipoprotein GldB n=1 Tax=Butyricimonas hominis TaxID=2763032 RepID=A0ABR7D2Z6_9BACT|nr:MULTISPECIES: hypothetical protein [Butyricimonas]MBC5622310.1 hypothetical protein [Butyricimonas hominis]MCB6974471.1 hypothetical protein [Butyricimonas synergistica]MCG4521324.1 hypothetical protein [Butyricimonas sp. DFI.6.44]
MERIRLMIICVLLLGFYACSNEDDIHAKVEDSWYNLEDDPSDPVQHYIYQFYQDYRTIIIKDPEVEDYRYNFKKRNNIKIVAPVQEAVLLQKGLDMVKDVFIDIYPDNFKKKYFPYSIIMADSVLFLGMEDQIPSYHAYASTNFVAIAGIRTEMNNYTDSDIREIRGEVNAKFWSDYLAAVKGVFVIPDDFYEVSKKFYGQSDWDWDVVYTPDDVDWHEMGFISYDPGNTSYDDDPILGGWWIQAPNKSIDVSQWLEFVFRVTPGERDMLLEKYPLMKKKYRILQEAIKGCDGFDISNLE